MTKFAKYIYLSWTVTTHDSVYIRKEHVVLPVKRFASKMTTAYRLHWAHSTIVIVITTFQVNMLFYFVCLPNKLIELNLSMQLLEHLICSSFSVWQTRPICKKYSTMFPLEWEHAKCYKKKRRWEKHLRLASLAAQTCQMANNYSLRGDPWTKGMIFVSYIKGREGRWLLTRLYWIVRYLSMM